MLIYGRNTVTEALKEGKVETLYLTNNTILKDYHNLAKSVKIVDPKKLNDMVKGTHQGCVAVVEDYKTVSIEDLVKMDKETLVILDGLEDPHNFGAILRSADATGITGFIIPKNRCVGLTSTVAKVSTGAIEHIDVSVVTNLTSTINLLKNHGYWIIGLELDGSVDYRKQDYSFKKVFIIGSEGKGISRLVKEKCDFLVNIPMIGHVNSLNASVSAGILFYEAFRQTH